MSFQLYNMWFCQNKRLTSTTYPVETLKFLRHIIYPVLDNVINNSLNSGVFPQFLITGRVVPILKCDDRSDIGNYWQILLREGESSVGVGAPSLGFFPSGWVLQGSLFRRCSSRGVLVLTLLYSLQKYFAKYIPVGTISFSYIFLQNFLYRHIFFRGKNSSYSSASIFRWCNFFSDLVYANKFYARKTVYIRYCSSYFIKFSLILFFFHGWEFL